MTNENSPIFILGCHKSGTSLLRNLLDGHTSLFVIPTESHFFQNTGSWVDYYSRRTQPSNLSYDKLKENLFRTIDFANNTCNEIADQFTKGKWDINLLKESLASEKVTSLKELSDLYVKALYKSLYKKEYDSTLRWVEKSVENNEFVLEWMQLYPNARFIYILRNPYANLVAIKKFREVTKSNPFPVKSALSSMYNSYYFLYKNKNLLSSKQFKVIQYEQLLTDPEGTMKDIADFIGIHFNELMLQPTLMGEQWKGNSSYGSKFTAISNENLQRWKQDITKSEIDLINQMFTHVLKDYNYEIIHTGREFKKGSLREILFNKILGYYMPSFKEKKK